MFLFVENAWSMPTTITKRVFWAQILPEPNSRGIVCAYDMHTCIRLSKAICVVFVDHPNDFKIHLRYKKNNDIYRLCTRITK